MPLLTALRSPRKDKESVRRDKSRAVVDKFFEWCAAELPRVLDETPIQAALRYATNQRIALRRFLDDGRLRMDNNSSENALRIVATGRKAWLFFGSDDHAQAAANLYSLIAGCKLHSLDPERYLAEMIRIMPYWPRDRYLELAPAYWAQTRARLDPVELEAELGFVTVPPVLVDTAQQSSPS